MGKTIEPKKKTRSISAGKQSRIDRIVNEEAEEEIRDEYLKHIVDISDNGKEEN